MIVVAYNFYNVIVILRLFRVISGYSRTRRIITGRNCPQGSSAGIVFTHGPIFRFFAPQGRHVAPIKMKFGSVIGDMNAETRNQNDNFKIIMEKHAL